MFSTARMCVVRLRTSCMRFMARGHPVDEGEAIRAILTHRGEPVDPPRIAPARGPPLWEATARQSDDALLAQPIPEFEFDQRIAW